MKIKIKSLAAEALIIRQDERKLSGEARNSLHNHRVVEVRREARASLLAYAYLRHRSYDTIERPGSRPVDWDKVRRIINRFGGSVTDDYLKIWYTPRQEEAA